MNTHTRSFASVLFIALATLILTTIAFMPSTARAEFTITCTDGPEPGVSVATNGCLSGFGFVTQDAAAISVDGGGGGGGGALLVAPTPTASIIATPSAVNTGETSQLTWISTNATSCTGTNFSTNNSTSGNLIVTLSATTLYTVTCTNSTGSASASATVTVNPPPAPTVSLTASPTSVTVGGSSVLAWTSSNASSCTINQGVGSVSPNSSGQLTVSPSSTLTYSMTCQGLGGTTISTTGSGTWQFQDSDVTDLTCPLTDLNLAYAHMSNCPTSPAGTSCSPSGSTCKINTRGNACNILTDIYSCVAAGTTGASTSASAYATVTVNPAQCSPNQGAECTSAPNSCAQSNRGTISCNGSCSVSTPSNASCLNDPVPPGTTSLSALLTALPTTVVGGETALLSWISASAVSCTGGNFSTGGSISGTRSVTPLSTTLYTLTCTDSAGNNAFSTATVAVVAPTLMITATPALVRSGDSTTISWSVVGSVTSCALSGRGISSSATFGSQRVVVTAESVYSLSCFAGSFTPSVSTSVRVLPSFREF